MVAFGAYAEFFRAYPCKWADVAAFELVGAHYFALGGVGLFFAKGDVHAQDFGAVKEALGVLLQAEDGSAFVGFVGAQAFKSATAVVHGVGEDVDFGIAPIDELAVHPDFAVAVVQGGRVAHGGFLVWGQGLPDA